MHPARSCSIDMSTERGSTLIEQGEARELGRMLADTAQRLGVHAAFPLADYDSIVGRNIGSHLAVKEMVAFLRDPSDQPRLLEFVITMTGEMSPRTPTPWSRGVTFHHPHPPPCDRK